MILNNTSPFLALTDIQFLSLCQGPERARERERQGEEESEREEQGERESDSSLCKQLLESLGFYGAISHR